MTSIAPDVAAAGAEVVPSPDSGTPTPAAPGAPLTAENIKWPPTETDTETPDASPEPDATPEPEAETPPAEPVVAPEVHTVELALPVRDGKEQGTIALDLPTQEVADVIRHNVKQAARVPGLEAKLDQYSGEAQTLAYIRDHPEDGFGLLAQNYPQAAQSYLKAAIESDPLFAGQALQAMGFEVTMLKEEDTISAKAELAKLKQADRLRQGQSAFAKHQSAATFADAAAGVVEDLTRQIGITPDHPRYSLFTTAAQQEFQKLYQQNPRAGQAAMLTALTPLVTEFQHMIADQSKRSTLKATLAAEQTRDPAGKFAATAAKTDKFRKLAGGQTPVTALGATKAKPGETWEEASARLKKMGNTWQ